MSGSIEPSGRKQVVASGHSLDQASIGGSTKWAVAGKHTRFWFCYGFVWAFKPFVLGYSNMF